MIVADIMTRQVVTVPIGLTVGAALTRAGEHDIHHLVIVEKERLRGVVCVCQLLDQPTQQTLNQLPVGPPEVIWPQSSLTGAAYRFMDKNVSCFPVCDGAELVGVITRSDLRLRQDESGDLPISFDCGHCGSLRQRRPE